MALHRSHVALLFLSVMVQKNPQVLLSFLLLKKKSFTKPMMYILLNGFQ